MSKYEEEKIKALRAPDKVLRDFPGQPPKYEKAEVMQVKIAKYFKECPDVRLVPVGFKLVEVPCPTITGLVLYLGFCDRASFYDYEKRKEFSHTIKTARSFMEREYENLLRAGNCTGAIFALKNFGWKDKQELDITEKSYLHKDLEGLTAQELEEEIARLESLLDE